MTPSHRGRLAEANGQRGRQQCPGRECGGRHEQHHSGLIQRRLGRHRQMSHHGRQHGAQEGQEAELDEHEESEREDP